MDTQIFLDHFERLTDAPDAVARLRELVLQLAVQGKLVAQDERDEPAACLLERIEAERKRLVREKQIKEVEPLPPVANDEKPFEIPDSWRWVRLGHVAGYCLGKMLDQHKNRGNPLPYLRNVNVRWFDFDLSDVLEMRFEDDELERFDLRAGDVLICEGGEPGRAAIWDGRMPGMKFQKALHRVRPSAALYNRFLVYLLLVDAKTGKLDKHFTGATIKHFTGRALARYAIALPPLEEQKRIVAKVDELMRLCDEVERAQGARREARLRLNRAALDQLLATRDAAEFQARWQTVSDHFQTLTATPDLIGKLRQTVLQLAVQGKLTRQDPQDEPAPALLRRIRAERERLVKEKKIKRADPLPPVNPDETPFTLPGGWAWVRLGDFGPFSGGGTPSKSNPEFWQGDIPWVSPKDMKRLYISDSIDHITDKAIRQSTAQLISQNSLLFVVRGMILAHSFPVALTLRDVTINQDMKAVQLVNPDTAEFLLLACRGLKDEMLKRVVRSSHGTCRLESEDVERFPIPLPPLEEQKRIVAAVNRLMALCDELEVGLCRAEEDGERLLRAAVRSLLAPALKDEAEQSAELVA